jgi:hypothetical protein
MMIDPGKKLPMTTEMKPQRPKIEIDPQHLEEDVRVRAYELYEARGQQDGHDLEDWFRAEDEIIRKKARSIAA